MPPAPPYSAHLGTFARGQGKRLCVRGHGVRWSHADLALAKAGGIAVGSMPLLRARPDDVFIGSLPLAFTFGLGGLLLFPLSIGASAVLLEQTAPDALPPAIAQFGATVRIAAPTSYRALAALHDRAALGRAGA